jgi:hypothetical protein
MPADASGRILALNLNGGVSPINALTGSGYSSQTLPQGAFADAGVLGDATGIMPVVGAPSGVSTMWWLIGLVVILVVMHIAGRHPKLGGVTDEFAGVNVWNFIAIGLQATVFLLTFKLGVNKIAPTSTLANVVNFA